MRDPQPEDFHVGMLVEYIECDPDEAWNPAPYDPGDILVVIPQADMGISTVRLLDGLASMVWETEIRRIC